MNIPTPYTPLESLLVFRGVGALGLDDSAFGAISASITGNGFIKDDPRYNPGRLTPALLRELFLDLLWDELKAGNAHAASRPGGASPPAPKKRRLQTPPRPTVYDAARHIDKIKSGHKKLQDAYFQEAIALVNQLEDQHQNLQEDIRVLEAAEGSGQLKEGELKAQAPDNRTAVARTSGPGVVIKNGLDVGRQPGDGIAIAPNGVGPSPPPPLLSRPLSPRPPPLPQTSPGAVGAANHGSPQPPQLLPNQSRPTHPVPPPGAPVLVQPQAPRLHRRESPPQASTGKIQDAARLPGSPTPGLQPPQGLPLFPPVSLPSKPLSPVLAPQLPAEALQRPVDVSRPKQAPVQSPINPQSGIQGQLRWEPPYQPNTPAPRHPPSAAPQQPGQGVIQAPQTFLQQQTLGQTQHRTSGPPSSPVVPRPLQPQSARPGPPQGLVPPHGTGQFTPAIQPAPIRPSTEPHGHSQNKQQLLAPNMQLSRAPVPAHLGNQQTPQPRPTTSSPTPPVVAPPRAHPSLIQPQPPRPTPRTLQAPHTQPGIGPMPAARGLAQPDTQRGYTSPHPAQHPVVPDPVPQQRLPSTPAPTPPARLTPLSLPPQTPTNVLSRLLIGSGTKWSATSTPSTPTQGLPARVAGFGDTIVLRPVVEPLSPVQQHSILPQAGVSLVKPQEARKGSETPVRSPPKRKPGRPRGPQRAQDAVSPSKQAFTSELSDLQPVPSSSTSSLLPTSLPIAANTASEVKEAQHPVKEVESTTIKDEVMTPQPLTEAGDTTADESVTGRRNAPRHAKRKREELTPTPVQTPAGDQPSFFETEIPAEPAQQARSEVLWTRAFNRVCGSAIEQIIHHRFANMFAAPIREKDAPGYHKVILQPQDLKSIKAAISIGNRAAAQAAAVLPEGDQNTSSLWLPISEALLPPKAIINSGQLDRELAHMFANAIMYNPDSAHGPGPEFLVSTDESQGDGQEGGPQEGALGYKVDEFGVVNDARAMFTEVDKLLSELRSAEVRRTGGGRTGATTGTSTRQASVAHREASHTADDGAAGNHNHNGDDVDEQTATEAETGNVKRRRTTRG